MVGPLPQNPTVAAALSDYAVTQLFAAVNVEQVVTNALPPKAAFLAGPLTTELRSLATQTGQKVVASDQFNQVWVAADRTASSTLIGLGRGFGSPATGQYDRQVGQGPIPA